MPFPSLISQWMTRMPRLWTGLKRTFCIHGSLDSRNSWVELPISRMGERSSVLNRSSWEESQTVSAFLMALFPPMPSGTLRSPRIQYHYRSHPDTTRPSRLHFCDCSHIAPPSALGPQRREIVRQTARSESDSSSTRQCATVFGICCLQRLSTARLPTRTDPLVTSNPTQATTLLSMSNPSGSTSIGWLPSFVQRLAIAPALRGAGPRHTCGSRICTRLANPPQNH